MEILTAILLLINMFFVAEAPLNNQTMADFATKMEPYYAQAGIPTDTSNTSFGELPTTYWGATLWQNRCTNRVFLNKQFASEGHPFYNTPMWKYVLAHEWAHVSQGKKCWDNELEARLIALALLAEADEWGAVYTALEWMLILSASDEVLNQLNLPSKEYKYYQTINLNHLAVVELLVNDDDGQFQLRTGKFDARTLWGYLQAFPDLPEDLSLGGYR
jgi:hypothetical protein